MIKLIRSLLGRQQMPRVFSSGDSSVRLTDDEIYGYSANGLHGHPYSELILKWFDPRGYLEAYPDLHVLLEQKYDYEALLYHFVNNGFNEGRIYNYQLLRSFNPDFYRNFLNDDLKSLPDDVLMRHWVYEGVFKGYAGSERTDAALSSPFQVFNIGRVGSYSVVSAIEKCGFINMIHTHSDFEFGRSYPDSCLTFSQLMEIRFNLGTRPPLFIISGVRDPIAWLLSSIDRLIDSGSSELELHGSAKIFRGRIHFMLNFFKSPLLAGFNVFGNDFNAEAGYGLYTLGKHKLLVYRVDRLSKIEGVIADMIGCRNFKIERINQSSSSASRDLSSVFWKQVFNNEIVETLRKSDYMQHFFTEQEQSRIYEQL